VASVLITGWLIEQVNISAVPGIVIGTGVVSLIPLVLWTLAVPSIKRQDANTTSSEEANRT
jgi:hypothetical protein